MAGIYIHIPFCRQACHYCNFHFSTSLKNKEKLLASIRCEVEQRSLELQSYNFDTIYLGGGTPSLLNNNELTLLFKTLLKNLSIASDSEITLEANPEDINMKSLQHWSSLGVNRLSIGIQSFHDKDLKYMNRAHNADQSHKALEAVNKSEIQNITADLMFGLIDSNLEEWRSNLSTMVDYNIPHLSIYNLTIEEQTVFYNWVKKKKHTELSSKIQKEQFYAASEYLQTHGYDHYEISNYAKDGYQAKHNTNYWKRIPYFGFGPSAHSYLENIRKWNISNNSIYIKSIEEDKFSQKSEDLDAFDKYNEIIMLGLRTKWGIDKKEVLKFPTEIIDHFLVESKSMVTKGVLIENENQYILQHAYWYLADHFCSELFISKN